MSSVPAGALTVLLSRLVIHVAYFTDPLCPWSWVAEPRLRDILEEFSGQVDITYVMAGMAEDIHADQKLESTREASQATGVPAEIELLPERRGRKTQAG